MSLFTIKRWASAIAILGMLAVPASSQSPNSNQLEEKVEVAGSFLPRNLNKISKEYNIVLDSKTSGPIQSIAPQIKENAKARVTSCLDPENKTLYLEFISQTQEVSIIRDAACNSVSIACPTRTEIGPIEKIEQTALVKRGNEEYWIKLKKDESSQIIISGTFDGIKKLVKSKTGAIPVIGDIAQNSIDAAEKEESARAALLSREIDAEMKTEHHMSLVPDYVQDIRTLRASRISLKIPYYVTDEKAKEKFVAGFNIYFAGGNLIGRLVDEISFPEKEVQKTSDKRTASSGLEKYVFNSNEIPKGFSLITDFDEFDLKMMGFKKNPGEIQGTEDEYIKKGYGAAYSNNPKNKENMLMLTSYIPGINFNDYLKLFAGPNASKNMYIEYIAVYKGNNSYLIVNFIPKEKFASCRPEVEEALGKMKDRLGLELYWKSSAFSDFHKPNSPVERAPPIEPIQESPKQNSSKKRIVYEDYIVRAGDTLTTIAKREYDSADKWKMIYDANRDRIKSPGDFKVGLIIKLPREKNE